MTKRKIVDWAIVVNYDKDNCWGVVNTDDFEIIADMPDSVSGPIDDYLTETREDSNDTKG